MNVRTRELTKKAVRHVTLLDMRVQGYHEAPATDNRTVKQIVADSINVLTELFTELMQGES